MDKIEKKQMIESSLKSLFGTVPYAGNLLNEVIFNYRNQVKQERINKFANLLKEYFETADKAEIDIEYLKSEDFGDIFESILKRVTLNRSEKKLIRFKEILLNHLNREIEYSDQTENFLDLVGRLNETQISIMKHHNNLTVSLNLISRAFNRLRTEISEYERSLKKEVELLKKGHANNSLKFKKLIEQKRKEFSDKENLVKEYQEYRKTEFYKLSDKEYSILIQDLVSKGLLYDAGIGSSDFKAYQILGITEFGQEFLNFIKENNN